MNNLKSVRSGIQSAIEEAASRLRDQPPAHGGTWKSCKEEVRSRVIGNQVRGIGLRETPLTEQQRSRGER